MQNNPELNGKYLGTISKDFVVVADSLKEASYQVRKQGYSEFPIFPISKINLPLGQLLIDRKEINTDWNYYITYIDEFVQRGLIDEDKIDEFKSSYKNADEFCCLFVVDEEFTKFVHIPYPED